MVIAEIRWRVDHGLAACATRHAHAIRRGFAVFGGIDPAASKRVRIGAASALIQIAERQSLFQEFLQEQSMSRIFPSTLAMTVMLVLAGNCRAQSAEPDPEAMAQMYSSMGDSGSVGRMSDSDASCEQLYAESAYLDARVAAMPKAIDPMAASAKLQEDMIAARKKAMGGMRAKGMASSLLGMIPGVGGIAGGLASSALSRGGGGMDAVDEATRKAMKEMQDSSQVMMAGARLQARKGHVTQLFLARNCKVSTLDRGLVASARASLEASKGGSVAMTVPPTQAQATEPSPVEPPSTEKPARVGASE